MVDSELEKAPRRKPWHRPRNVALGLALAIVAGGAWFSIEVWRVYKGEPTLALNYRAAYRDDVVSRYRLDVEQAEQTWNRLASAGDHVGDVLDINLREFMRLLSARATPEELQTVRTALETLATDGTLDELAQIADTGPGLKPVVFGGANYDEDHVLAQIVSDAFWTRLPRPQTLRLHLALMDRRYDEATRVANEAMAMAQTASLAPGLMHHLIATSTHTWICRELTHSMLELQIPTDVCRRLLESLDAHPIADLADAIEGERAVLHEIVQVMYMDDGDGDGYMHARAASLIDVFSGAPPEPSLFDAYRGRFRVATRRESAAKLQEFYDHALDELESPFAERWQAFSLDAWRASLAKRDVLARMLPVDMSLLDAADTRRQLLEAGARIMLELEIFRADNGRYPDVLDDLPKAAPLDPVSGGQFVYRTIDDDPSGRPYVLYSVGMDGIDDGGVGGIPQGTREALQACPDLVVNTPRP